MQNSNRSSPDPSGWFSDCVICVNLAGVATFLVQGVRPRRWWEAERASKSTRPAICVWIALLAVLGLFLWLNRKPGRAE